MEKFVGEFNFSLRNQLMSYCRKQCLSLQTGYKKTGLSARFCWYQFKALAAFAVPAIETGQTAIELDHGLGITLAA